MAADRTNVVIKATDITGKQVSTTINYANPNASNSTLKTMGQMMNALTTNEYMQTNRTDITFLDTAPPTPADKQTPTLSIAGGNNVTIVSDGASTVNNINYNGDGVLYASNAGQNGIIFGIREENNIPQLLCGKPTSLTGGANTGTIYASEGTNYKAASIEFTFTY